MHIDLSNRAITDNHIAEMVPSPKPLSVSNIIEHLRSKTDITTINLKGNQIGKTGFNQLLDYLVLNCPTLEKLDISYNSIDLVDDNLEHKMLELVRLPNFKKLIVTANSFANFDWYANFIIENSLQDNYKIVKI